MKAFNDRAGRSWTITLTLGTAMTVKEQLGVDLLQPEAGDPPLLTRLGTDEMLLGEVLCAMLQQQRRRRADRLHLLILAKRRCCSSQTLAEPWHRSINRPQFVSGCSFSSRAAVATVRFASSRSPDRN